ncbi:MAG: TRAP transporter small permease subunit [Gammaproteobacteria bacterium]|nr:TRAP transporter small permease subunit [Gammaproteobacteria bacterium]
MPHPDAALRAFAALMAALVALFLLGCYLHYWRSWPAFFSGNGWAQWLGAAAVFAGVLWRVYSTPKRGLRDDAELYARVAAYVIRAAYWSVLLVGAVDALISFLRLEGILEYAVGAALAGELAKPHFRGVYVHYPLLLAALVIARYAKTPGFLWLALLVVMAEFAVVVSRFVFSYEQAFMGDLVRFWYAALFLFASAHTLAAEGHVRVDVLYANFSPRAKALSNAGGALLLGLPVCWTILLQGMSGKGASIVSPLLGFEISQSGYGMYVKYLMAGFLLVFAVSMALQFIGSFLENAAELRKPPPRRRRKAA